MIYTLVGEPFQDWINKRLKARTTQLCDKRQMNIKMDPEIFKIFKASTSVSGKFILISITNFVLQFLRASVDI